MSYTNIEYQKALFLTLIASLSISMNVRASVCARAGFSKCASNTITLDVRFPERADAFIRPSRWAGPVAAISREK